MIFKSEKKDVVENLIGLLIVILAIGATLYFLDFTNIKDTILKAGIWAPVILILAKAMTIVFAPLSGSALYPVAGAIFGFWPGLIYILIGDAIGSIVSFSISRRFGQKIVERMLSAKNMPTAHKIISMIETTRGFLFARVCFSPMPEIVSYAAGLTKISFWRFFIIHNAVGIIPSIILVGSGGILVSYHDPKIIAALLLGGTFAVIIGGILFWKFSKHFTN